MIRIRNNRKMRWYKKNFIKKFSALGIDHAGMREMKLFTGL